MRLGIAHFPLLAIGGVYDGHHFEVRNDIIELPLPRVTDRTETVLYRQERVCADWIVFYPAGYSLHEQFMDYRFFVPESTPTPYRADDETIRRLTAHFHGVRWK